MNKYLYTIALLLVSILGMQAKNSIKLITAKPVGSKFTISLTAPKGTKITMGGVKDGSITIPDAGYIIVKTTTTSSDIYISGAVTKVSCISEQLKEISVSGHSTLEHLYVRNNPIEKIYAGNCNKLNFINCVNNNFTPGGLSSFIRSLKERPTTSFGKLVISETPRPDKDHWTDHDIWLAASKYWTLCWSNMGPTTTTYERIKPTETMSCFFNNDDMSKTIRVRGVCTGAFTSEGNIFPNLTNEWQEVYLGKSSSTLFGKAKVLEIDFMGVGSSFYATGHEYIEVLSLTNGALQGVGISEAKNLRQLKVYNNKITGEKMTKMISALPSRKGKTPGILYLKSAQGTEGNEYTESDRAKARDRNWIIREMTSEGKEVERNATIELTSAKTTGDLNLYASYKTHLDIIGATGSVVKDNYGTYTLAGDASVRLLGDVTICKADKEGNDLTSVVILNHLSIESLELQGNKISHIDVTGCTALKEIRCYGNQLRGKDMSDFIATLPNRPNKDGKLYLSSGADDETNAYASTDIAKALERGWTVMTQDDTEITAESLSEIALTTTRTSGSTIDLLTQFTGSLNAQGVGATLQSQEGYQSIALTASEVLLTGHLVKFGCHHSDISQISLHQSTQLEELYVEQNALTALDVTGATALRKITAQQNQLNKDAVTALINTLPDRSNEKVKGELQLFETFKGKDETNEITSDHVRAANAKGWLLKDATQEITVELLATELVLRPQESDDTVYTLDGIRLFTPVDELPEGIYIIGGQKQIIRHIK